MTTLRLHRAPLRASLAAGLLAAGALPSAAQTPPPDTLAPIVVTVLRGENDARRVPYAVGRADAEALRLGKTGAFLEEALTLLPGVQVQNRYNYAVGERLAVRGFGPRAQFGIRGVRVLVDGIPATVADGQSSLDHLDLGSIGSAEVLRGPGSALYGNAAGGVLVLRTERPAPGPIRPDARTVFGSHGLVNTQAGVSGWTGESSLVVNAGLLQYKGFRPDPTGSVPGAAKYGEADRYLLNAQLATPAFGGGLRFTLNGVRMEGENPGSIPKAQLEEGDLSAWGGNVAQGTRKDVDQGQLGVVWEGPLGGGGGTGLRGELASWILGRSVWNPIPPTVIDLGRWASGLRAIVSGGDESDGGWSWGAGVEGELQRDDRVNFGNSGGSPGEVTLDQDERVRALGAFLRGGVGLGQRVRVTGALRYDSFRFELFDSRVTTEDPDDSGSRTMDAWSPTAGIVFEAGPRAVLWANVATAIETPTTTELVNQPDGSAGFNPAIDPQTSVALEGGVRGRLGRTMGYEVALFRTELEGELVPFEVPSFPGRTFFRNAGRSVHEGVEASVDLALEGGVDARMAFSRTDARFESYEVDGDDFAGNRVPGLAPNRLQLLLQQVRPRWHWSVEAEWNDDVPVDDANSESADAYWLVDLRAGLRDVRAAGLVASPFAGVSNVFDELYSASVTVNAFGGRYYEPGPGRTAYLGLGLRWEG